MNQHASTLVDLLIRHYQTIRAIEEQFSIFGEEGDYRPRIEAFHDAVRALTAGDAPERLRVERLAYDLAMLRYIASKPVTGGRGMQHFSTSDALSMDGIGTHATGEPDRSTRRELGEAYHDYAVFFAALFVERANRDSKDRIEEQEQLASDCATLIAALDALAEGKGSIEQVMHAVQEMEHGGIRRALAQLMARGKPPTPEIRAAIAKLKEVIGQSKTQCATLDKAAGDYALAQYAVYEQAQDTLKRLNAQGLNLAGKNVQAALAQGTGRGHGRGT